MREIKRKMTEMAKCDLCGSDENTILLRTRDYRYGHIETFNFVKCTNCGLIYMSPRPTFEFILSENDKDYISDEDINRGRLSVKDSKWKKVLRPFWYKFIGYYMVPDFQQKVKFIDIGCGCGDTLYAAREVGAEVYGIELNPKSAKVCKDKHLNVYCGTFEEVELGDNYFDAIWMSQVIEHLPSAKDSLRKVRRILKPGGRVYIFCPNAESYLLKLFGKYWEGWYAPFHFYVFTEDTIRRLATEVGLRVEKIKTTTPASFFTVSLKSYLWGEDNNSLRPMERGKFFGTLVFRASISPFLRLLDFVFKGKGDCLKIVMSKRDEDEL